MNIRKFQVINFKSFRDSGEVGFKPGFNVITGQNSAGKTALLEAMTLRFAANPHRSLRTIPAPASRHSQESIVRATFSLPRNELFDLIGVGPFQIPEPARGFMIPGDGPYERQADKATALLAWFSQEAEYSIEFRLTRMTGGGEVWTSDSFVLGKYPQSAPNHEGLQDSIGASVGENHRLRFQGLYNISPSAWVGSFAIPLCSRIYRFSAERFNVGQCPFGSSRVLAPNAQNLPEVLDTLTANPRRFAALNARVQEILPQVKQVSVRTLVNNQVQVIVWPHDPASQREDLAIPLNDCGSGVGQVLAILYVVLNADHPQVILIDEPQNFLHPGAVRKLIGVLKEYPHHQYIFTTHSPGVISAADPGAIVIAGATDGETSLQVIDAGNTDELRLYLADIGARLSDVFGADNILWVEGQTEERCLPRILEIVAKRPLKGTAVVGIRQTGDLQAREKKRIFEMYRRLSEARTLMPPAVAFVFDSECLSAAEKEDIRRAGQGLVHFLPRRMYENFILDVQAITEVANRIDGFRAAPVRAKEVQRLLDEKRVDLEYYCRGTGAIPVDWVSHIDAARVLRDVFSYLSENRVSYDKIKHSVAITEWLIENRPEHFREPADWLLGLLAANR